MANVAMACITEISTKGLLTIIYHRRSDLVSQRMRFIWSMRINMKCCNALCSRKMTIYLVILYRYISGGKQIPVLTVHSFRLKNIKIIFAYIGNTAKQYVLCI